MPCEGLHAPDTVLARQEIEQRHNAALVGSRHVRTENDVLNWGSPSLSIPNRRQQPSLTVPLVLAVVVSPASARRAVHERCDGGSPSRVAPSKHQRNDHH